VTLLCLPARSGTWGNKCPKFEKEQNPLAYETLRNYKMVASRFSPSQRNDKLTYSHHAAVARLAKSDRQVANKVLKECAEKNLSKIESVLRMTATPGNRGAIGSSERRLRLLFVMCLALGVSSVPRADPSRGRFLISLAAIPVPP